MIIDKYGQQIYREQDLIDIYMSNPEKNFASPILVSENIAVDSNLDLDNVPNLIMYEVSDDSIDQFDQRLRNNWFFPKEYKNFDIAKYILDQCQNEEELQRAGKELLLYQERDMFVLLQYLKYLVDTMRNNNIVWGVGRGSSVASFVLYLIGVHKINSLYYDLPIEEFLK
jgi:DNA polymerase III alpha subunit